MKQKCCFFIESRSTKGKKMKNKVVYTATFVAGGWAGAVMSWAGAVMNWAGAEMIKIVVKYS